MTKKIYSLQTMRLFAALMVFQYHLWRNSLNGDFSHPGTDFFIVLVGMVAAVAQSHRISEGNWKKYIQARYIRLYVSFIPIFAIYALAMYEDFDLIYFIKSFFFIPMLNKLPLIGPTWMLSMFLLFYWLFSLAFIFRRESILIPVFSLWILGILAYSSSLWNPNLPEEWSLILFKHRNIEFIFGYLGGKLLLSRKVGLKGGKWIFTLGIASLIAAIVLLNNNIIPYASRTFSYGIPLTLISLGLGALEQNNSPSPILKIIIHPWLVWLGGASYVLYLIHNMVLIVWGKIIPITPIQVPLITITVILISAIGYHFWEKPILRYVKTKMV